MLPNSRRYGRRRVLGLLLGGTLAGTVGCGADGGTGGAGTGGGAGTEALRSRIVTGLQAQGSEPSAEVVDRPATELLLVDLPALPRWQLVDVRNNEMPHPFRMHLAVTRQDPVEVVALSGFPGRWPRLLEQASVTDAPQALRVARVHFDVTRSMSHWGTRLESFDELRTLPAADPARVQELRARFADRIGAPRPEPTDLGWSMTVWAQENDAELVERRTVVTRGCDVRVQRTVLVPDLPVPVSV